MKNVEELAGTTVRTTDVTVITQALISQQLERYARGQTRVAQIFKLNRDLLNASGRVLEVPKVSTATTVDWYTEGQTISTAKLAYDAVTFTVRKLGVGLRFTTEAIQDAKRDIIADALEDSGREVAKKFDDMAIEALFTTASLGAAASSTTSVGDGTLICGISGTLTGGITKIINQVSTSGKGSCDIYGDASGGTATFYIVDTDLLAGGVAGATNSNSITSRKLLDANNKVVAKYYEPNVVLMHDEKFADLLYDSNTKFLDKSAYGSTSGLLNAEVGKVMGLRVVTTNRFPQWCMMVADTNHLGYHVLKRMLKMKRDEITGYNQDALFFWGWAQRTIGVMMTDSYAVAVQGSIAVFP